MSTAVVILNYNGERLLGEYLPQVVRFSAEADVIVADNGSQDGSLQLLKERFPEVRVIALERNYGFAEGYNRAFAELSDYEFAVMLNSDVEVTPGWLTPLIGMLEREKDVAAVQPKILSLREREKFEYAGAAGGFIDWLGYPFCRGRILSHVESDEGQYDTPNPVFWASGACMALRLNVYRDCDGMCAEFFAHQEEIDLCWRMQLRGWRIMAQPASRVYHLGGATLSMDNPWKLRLNHRNNLAMLMRCASPAQRFCVSVIRPVLDALEAVVYLLKGKREMALAIFGAWREFLLWHKRLLKQRREIRSGVRREAFGIYHYSIILRYIFVSCQFGQKLFR